MNSKKPDPPKDLSDLPDPNGPGTLPVRKESHKMVQGDKGVDPHHRSGDRNVDDKGD